MLAQQGFYVQSMGMIAKINHYPKVTHNYEKRLRSYECQQVPTQFYNNDIVSGNEIIMR